MPFDCRAGHITRSTVVDNALPSLDEAWHCECYDRLSPWQMRNGAVSRHFECLLSLAQVDDDSNEVRTELEDMSDAYRSAELIAAGWRISESRSAVAKPHV